MLEPKQLHRKLESLLAAGGAGASPRRYVDSLAGRLVEVFGDAIGLASVQVYDRRDGALKLRVSRGEKAADLSAELARRLFAGGGEDWIPDLPWAGSTAAGPAGLIEGAEESLYVALLFRRAGEAPTPAQILSLASPLQYMVANHLRRRELEDLIEQARAIQVSLLPTARPAFGDFDIAAASVPARIVGGDFFDFIPLDAETLAVTVCDASGHGLPAALQARDVATGLRMGVERDLKITRTVEKLNRVIHRSGLSSRFVSLVFGELELNGNFIYVNAGHPPPMLLDDRGLAELSVGGMILGPHAEAAYKLGFAHVDRGAALVLYSDGVVECGTTRGEPFGPGRLAGWLRDWRDGPAEEAVADLLARLREFDGQPAFEDDVTAVLIRRPR